MNGAELREYELVFALQPGMDDGGLASFAASKKESLQSFVREVLDHVQSVTY